MKNKKQEKIEDLLPPIRSFFPELKDFDEEQLDQYNQGITVGLKEKIATHDLYTAEYSYFFREGYREAQEKREIPPNKSKKNK